MGMLVSAVAALGTFYPDAKDIHDTDSRDKQILRLIAKMPTLAAMCYRFSVGLPFVYPDNSLSLPGQLPQHDVEDRRVRGRPGRSSGRWTCCSSSTPTTSRTAAPRRCASSARATPIRTRRAAAAASALYGPLHGGANEAGRPHAHRDRLASTTSPAFIDDVKAGKGRLMGFGHRVYKNYDPRATIIKQTAYDVFEVTGKNPLLDIALEARGGGAQRRRTSSTASCTRTSTSTRA